ncbi:MAG: synthase [Limnochordaceae bacterium]|nr:synthase [Limnochordaceae bacterium]
MQVTVIGSYPKLPEAGGGPNIRRAIHQFEAGQISLRELEEAMLQTVERVIREQEEAGVDLVTDGQVRWDDLVTPFARDLGSVEIGGLVRFFDNNVYYRRPVVKGRVWWRGSSLAHEVRQAAAMARKALKVALPGPLTFVKLSVNEHYRSWQDLAMDVAQALQLEARALVEAGARAIQFDEPSLLFDASDEEWKVAAEALREAARDLDVPVTVATYFRDGAGVVDRLAALDMVDVVGLDLASGPDLAGYLAAHGFPRAVNLGLVNGREWRLEQPGELARTIEAVGRRMGMGRISVSPNCGLEFLPQSRALAKLRVLKEAADLAVGAPARG